MSLRKASTTAFIVITSLVKLAQLPQWRKYFSNEMVILNKAFSQHARDSLTKRFLSALSPAVAIKIMDSFFIPGLMQFYIIRKRFIEEQVVSAIEGGAQQVINLGAGFDTLALRMAKKYPAVQFFEIDLSNTQNVKMNALQHINHAAPPNCHFISADLGQTKLKEVLAAETGFNVALSSLVILEGVLMYLSEEEVKKLFAEMHGIFAGSLLVVFGATNISTAKGTWSMRAINHLLRRGNEGAKWSCLSKDMAGFVGAQSYKLKNWISYKKLHDLYPESADIKNLPDENENYYIIEKT